MADYILKKYDKDLVKFELLKTSFGDYKCHNIILIGNKEDLPEELVDNQEKVVSWLKSRIIPRNRKFVHEILKNQGLVYNDLEGILNVCMGLSVNDAYWVVSPDFKGRFNDFNLYENSFSNALGLVAFTGHYQTIHKLSPSPEMTTNGMLPKAWRRINDDLYLYKGGTDSSFANGGNEPYSEFYASQIADVMGIPHVHYDLEQWKDTLACVCKNFTDLNHSYVPLGKLLKDEYSIENLNSLIDKLDIKKEFSNMILFDAVILNSDRHLGNFGLLKNNNTNEYEKLAPLFDNGISLLSHLSENNISDDIEYKEFIETNNHSALGLSHNELVKLFCDKTHITMLNKLHNFKIKKHDKYNVSDIRIKRIEQLVQYRIHELIKILSSLIIETKKKSIHLF